MQDDLDYVLGAERPIEPSADFARTVMRAIRNEALAPPPIPFPWRRLAIGAAATGVIAAAVTLLPQFDSGWLGLQFSVRLQHINQALTGSGAFWLAAGGLVSYLSVKLSLLTTA